MLAVAENMKFISIEMRASSRVELGHRFAAKAGFPDNRRKMLKDLAEMKISGAQAWETGIQPSSWKSQCITICSGIGARFANYFIDTWKEAEKAYKLQSETLPIPRAPAVRSEHIELESRLTSAMLLSFGCPCLLGPCHTGPVGGGLCCCSPGRNNNWGGGLLFSWAGGWGGCNASRCKQRRDRSSSSSSSSSSS